MGSEGQQDIEMSILTALLKGKTPFSALSVFHRFHCCRSCCLHHWFLQVRTRRHRISWVWLWHGTGWTLLAVRSLCMDSIHLWVHNCSLSPPCGLHSAEHLWWGIVLEEQKKKHSVLQNATVWCYISAECVPSSPSVLYPPIGLKVQRPNEHQEEEQQEEQEEQEGKAKPRPRKEKEAKPNPNPLRRQTPGNWHCSAG